MLLKGTRRKNNHTPPFFAVAFFVAAMAGLINLALPVLMPVGETAAVISAALNMPDVGIQLLRERFGDVIYAGGQAPPREEEPAKDPVSQVEPPPHELPDKTEKPKTDNASSAEPSQPEPNVNPPNIPAKYKANIINEDFSGQDNTSLIKLEHGYVKNDTQESDGDIREILEQDLDFDFSGTDGPLVLLLHTHATESFERYDADVYDTRNTWRSTDNNNNMAAVGAAMREVLAQNGIGVIHDTTQHDYPSYNGSYDRSAETVRQYLEQYPSIKLVFDLHRDAMEREEQAIVKPVAFINGKKAAQVMIVSGCDDGSMDMPGWRENLKLAAAIEDKALSLYPGLLRPVYLCHRKYNMDLLNGYLLIEFGSNANTLDEAVYSARMMGEVVSRMIKENRGLHE